MISVENLHKSFQTETVLAGLSLNVLQGSIVAVLGPSGAGKTTLLNIIAGIVATDDGKVLLDPDAKLGYMLQEPALLPWRTIEENARLGAEVVNKSSSASNRVVDELFLEFGLDSARKKYPAQCSVGMQQRAALIRTLAVEPNVLLLDEPFSSLDYDIKLRVETTLVRHVVKGKTAVLLVTHDIEDAIALADTVIIMSTKPGTNKAELQIDLGLSNRDPVRARTSEKFRGYFELIWERLKYLS